MVAWDKLINAATQEMMGLDFEVGDWDSGRVMGGVRVVADDFQRVLPDIHSAQAQHRLPIVFLTRSTPPRLYAGCVSAQNSLMVYSACTYTVSIVKRPRLYYNL